MTCPVCKAPSAGTKPCPGYCEGVEDGRAHEWCPLEHCGIPRCVRCGVPNKLSVLRNFPHCPKMGAAERAILERDIAEVERALENLGGEALVAQMDAQNAADDVDFCMQMGDSMADRQWWEASAEDYRAHALREQERSAKASALARYRFAMLADCEAWLVRARAALGGGA